MFLKKINHTKHAIKCRIEVFKCLKSFINTPNIYVQDRENVFTKTFRSSHPEVFCIKCVLRNFAKFTGKHLC